MKRFTTLAGLAFAALLGSFAMSAPAHATPACTAFTDSSGTYPADSSGHEQICFSATSQDKLAIATAVRQLPRGTNQAYNRVAGNGGIVFFFQNRDDAISFFQNTAPYSSYPFYKNAASTGHCGFTIGTSSGTGVVTGIFKTCSYDGVTPNTGTNPDLNHTVKHEMGHAYDIAQFVATGQVDQPSSANGYSVSTSPPNYLQDGLNKLTPANWSTLTSTQKASVVCGIWSNIQFSPLEQSLVFSATGSLPAASSVCVTSGPTMVIQTPYVGFTPSQIAQKVAPYFVNTPKEAWAEQFAVAVGVTTPPSPGFLQLSDRIFINTNYQCAVMDVTRYTQTNLPPSQTIINNNHCSFTPFDL